ncbi:hypothetical protein J1N35_024884 [Gossypium stocksii]|uniref:RNase H type-1 domain-containing protein n=1 Tax=Gossypium stocksii TaxID=47602 RepID=A0A9D3ZX56_9ROSI|nr:hypothetical protein J1N35_024884 [Gossypium stocksii]
MNSKWNNRNNFTFRGKEKNAITIWNKAFALSNDFRIYNLREKPMIPIQPTVRRWKKLARGVVKINVDAAINEECMGLEVIARDDDGFVLGGHGCIKKKTFNSDWAMLTM